MDHIAAVHALAEHTQAETAEDLRTRWWPAPTAVAHAKALLAAEPAADMAVIPMYQPGKQVGLWTYGQEVRTVHGVIFLAANRFTDPEPGSAPIPPYSWARNAAEDVAATERVASWKARCTADPSRMHAPGTTGHATVTRDPQADDGINIAVFEGPF